MNFWLILSIFKEKGFIFQPCQIYIFVLIWLGILAWISLCIILRV